MAETNLKEAIIEWFEEREGSFSNDPFHLTFIPLGRSPQYNRDKGMKLYSKYQRAGLIEVKNDGSCFWRGPERTSLNGRPCGYMKSIYSSICFLGVPKGYRPVSFGEDRDITVINMYLVRDNTSLGVQYKKFFEPFCSSLARGKIFGAMSASELYNRMNFLGSTNPVERWQAMVVMCTSPSAEHGDVIPVEGLAIADDFSTQLAGIIGRVKEKKGGDSELPCFMLGSKVNFDKISVATHPVRCKINEEVTTVRLHRFLWGLVFNSSSTDSGNSLSVCPNKWCVNPFHYSMKHEVS